MKSSIKKILDIADRTLYNWKKEQKPIVLLLEKYFTKEDLEEFLDTGEIRRFENYDASRADPLFIEYIKYNLPTKIDAIKGEGIIDRLNRLIPRKIFISILEDLRNEEDIELYQRKSKNFSSTELKDMKPLFMKVQARNNLWVSLRKPYPILNVMYLLNITKRF